MSKFPESWLNTIQCMDCMEGLERIPDKSVNLVLTDPPYGISRKINCKGTRLGTTAKLDFDFGDWDKFNKKWFDLAVQKSNGWVMTFCAKKDIGHYWDILENNKYIAIDTLAWTKPDPLPFNAKTRFLSAWEAIVVGKRPGTFFGSNYMHDVIKCQSPKNGNRIHPTQKPLKLIKELIELTTHNDEIVLDPFMGCLDR